MRTGSPWAEVPDRYGPATTCYNRFVRWRKAGVWDRLLEAVSAGYESEIVMIDQLVSACLSTGHEKRNRCDGGMGRFPIRPHKQYPRA